MKKICFVGSFTNGGTEKATFNLVNNLCDSYKIVLLNTSQQNSYFKLNIEIPMYYLDGKNLFDSQYKIFKFIKKHKIDIMVSVEAGVGLYTLIPAKITKTKHIIWEHANYYQQHMRYITLLRQIELYICDHYVVLTKRDKNTFVKKFHTKNNISQIYNIQELTEKTNNYNLNSKVIISVGHLRDIKNFLVIPELGKEVFKKHNDWKWYIVGEGNDLEYKTSLIKMISKYNLQDNIILKGKIKEMDNIYKEASFFVLTSKMEGLPLVMLEAQEFKLPIISFDIETGPDEIVVNGSNGFLIEPFDIDEMVSKIVYLIENDNERIKFSNNATINANKFSVSKIIPQWIKVFEQI